MCHEYHKINETGNTMERFASPIIVVSAVNQLFHMEHHLFPTVPSNHLPQLAKRLDKVAPEMTKLRVLLKMI